MEGGDEPERKKHPTGGFIRGMFADVQSTDDFASKLGVSFEINDG